MAGADPTLKGGSNYKKTAFQIAKSKNKFQAVLAVFAKLGIADASDGGSKSSSSATKPKPKVAPKPSPSRRLLPRGPSRTTRWWKLARAVISPTSVRWTLEL